MTSQLQEASLLDPQTRARLAACLTARARQQGSLRPREIRDLLTAEGLPPEAWREPLSECRTQLRFKQGRYYPVSPLVMRLHEARENQRGVQRAVRHLLRRQRELQAQFVDRRQHARLPFLRPVTVHTGDGRALGMYSCEISASGIRLIGIYNLQGTRVRLTISAPDEQGEEFSFGLHVLWAKPVADNLFENGGVFERVQT